MYNVKKMKGRIRRKIEKPFLLSPSMSKKYADMRTRSSSINPSTILTHL